jgi:hypothetical protein
MGRTALCGLRGTQRRPRGTGRNADHKERHRLLDQRGTAAPLQGPWALHGHAGLWAHLREGDREQRGSQTDPRGRWGRRGPYRSVRSVRGRGALRERLRPAGECPGERYVRRENERDVDHVGDKISRLARMSANAQLRTLPPRVTPTSWSLMIPSGKSQSNWQRIAIGRPSLRARFS